MEWITSNWGLVAAAILAVLRVIESIKVIKDNAKVVSFINVLKEILTLG